MQVQRQFLGFPEWLSNKFQQVLIDLIKQHNLLENIAGLLLQKGSQKQKLVFKGVELAHSNLIPNNPLLYDGEEDSFFPQLHRDSLITPELVLQVLVQGQGM